MTDPKAQNLDCLHENDLHGYCYSCGEDLFAKQDPKAQDWKERFQDEFICASRRHKHLLNSRDEKIGEYFAEKIMDFIVQEIAAAEERAEKRILELVFQDVQEMLDGSLCQETRNKLLEIRENMIILNSPPTNTDGDGV